VLVAAPRAGRTGGAFEIAGRVAGRGPVEASGTRHSALGAYGIGSGYARRRHVLLQRAYRGARLGWREGSQTVLSLGAGKNHSVVGRPALFEVVVPWQCYRALSRRFDASETDLVSSTRQAQKISHVTDSVGGGVAW